jgi:3-deoxy-D-manno-octulosonic-acid transferase
MIRVFLDALYWEVLVFAFPFWLWKVPQARRYRAGIFQRLGFVPRREGGGRCLWVHCSSVGEASIPRELVRRFRERHGEWEVVFSTFTDTGAERLRKLYPDCEVFYWPLDLSCCVDRALGRLRPDAVLLVEQELWPNFLLGCRERGVPVGVVNGRMRARSVPLVRGIGRLVRPMWEAVKMCCARSEADGWRFGEAGLDAGRIEVSGSLKYEALPDEVDSEVVSGLRGLFEFSGEEPVLVAGSTHPGEEIVLCRVWERLRQRHPDLRLVVVPRHIERGADLAEELTSAGFEVARKTDLDAGAGEPSEDAVILVDTIGDLVGCYGLATCAFVGRSLFAPGGGQNMMEPAALGVPVIVGRQTGNFEPEMEVLRDRGAVVEVTDEGDLERAVGKLLTDAEHRLELGERGRRAIRENRGAAEATLDAIQRMMLEEE